MPRQLTIELALPSGNTQPTGSGEHYTPYNPWIRLAREGLKSKYNEEIPFDLASCEQANKTVNAEFYFSKSYRFHEHHHEHQWQRGFWCNPDYKNIPLWSDIICAENYVTGYVLVPSDTSASWWQDLAKASSAIVFPNERIPFTRPDGSVNKDVSRGQTFFLFNVSNTASFQPYGQICHRVLHQDTRSKYANKLVEYVERR